jgi:hypothetical protein
MQYYKNTPICCLNIDTKRKKIDTKPMNIDTNRQKIDTKPKKIDTNCQKIDTKPKKIDTNCQKIDTNRQEIDTKRVIGLSKTLEIDTYNKSHSFEWLLFSITTNLSTKIFLQLRNGSQLYYFVK